MTRKRSKLIPGGMYRVTATYFFKTDEEFAEIERVVWGTEESEYADSLSERACGGHDGVDSQCRFDVGFGSVVYSEESKETYLDCSCKCCHH